VFSIGVARCFPVGLRSYILKDNRTEEVEVAIGQNSRSQLLDRAPMNADRDKRRLYQKMERAL
jgi:hypothetical protein